jgi:hypothetical protein
MIPRDIVLSTVIAFIEVLAERIFLPGLHRRIGLEDMSRIDDFGVLGGQILALLILIWTFYFGLYTISFFTTRPIKPNATAIVGVGLALIVFIGSAATWFGR